MNTLEIIRIYREAAKLVRNGWTQGTYARDLAGRKVGHWDVHAVRFCALGALRRASGAETCEHQVNRHLYEHLGRRLIDQWNDGPNTDENVAKTMEAVADKLGAEMLGRRVAMALGSRTG